MPVVPDLTPMGQLLLGTLLTIAIGAFGYLMGRIGSLDEKLDDLGTKVTDLHQRMYGREHDRTDPGGILGEVRAEFDGVHSRIDHLARRLERDRRERRKERRHIDRKLDTITDNVRPYDRGRYDRLRPGHRATYEPRPPEEPEEPEEPDEYDRDLGRAEADHERADDRAERDHDRNRDRAEDDYDRDLERANNDDEADADDDYDR